MFSIKNGVFVFDVHDGFVSKRSVELGSCFYFSQRQHFHLHLPHNNWIFGEVAQLSLFGKENSERYMYVSQSQVMGASQEVRGRHGCFWRWEIERRCKQDLFVDIAEF